MKKNIKILFIYKATYLNISGNLIQKLAQVANDPLKEITTVIVKASPDEFDDPSVVKVATTFTNNNPKVDDVGRALYFSRACIPTGSEKYLASYWDLCVAKRYFRKICKTKTFPTRKVRET